MVLPFVDEDKPKCFLCHQGFENMEKLHDHQQTVHKDYFEFHDEQVKREPAPGDVTVF
jgi:hypothetical protein